MSWDKDQMNYGVVKIEGSNKVKVFKSQTNYTLIAVSEDITDARWGGDAVVVYLKNGKVRRYTSTTSYTIV